MAGMIGRVARFARSPQGQKLTRKAMEIAKDPATRQKIEGYRRKLADRRR
ncbi:MAG: hypothetical protein QOJ07_1068 [Thermoleophilaceae bacterium]|jgi:hypothetical protein|nr:hypothetical protein [Thermoleophilaceae bacterium]